MVGGTEPCLIAQSLPHAGDICLGATQLREIAPQFDLRARGVHVLAAGRRRTHEAPRERGPGHDETTLGHVIICADGIHESTVPACDCSGPVVPSGDLVSRVGCDGDLGRPRRSQWGPSW